MTMIGSRTCRIIFNLNPIHPLLACSTVKGHWPSLLARRYDKPRTDEKDHHRSAEKGTDHRSNTDRAPSMAEEFNRIADEKHLKEAPGRSSDKQSETSQKTASDQNLDDGPNYRPCS
ncbi:hypothetical protein SDJN03_10126, partial [Cucurbita argyrosperma subsp. sororia]